MNSDSGNIRFFTDGISYTIRHKIKLRSWLHLCAKREKNKIGDLNFIFTSDEDLKKINKQYLNHDYFTDIITFPIDDNGSVVGGEIFISIDRVKENAKLYRVRINEELHRVMIHGLLHLCGYGDKSESEQVKMRDLETRYLKIWGF
jgi:probable rRNA maturation factor